MATESSIESISSACVLLLDFLDVHENDGLGSADDNDTSTLALRALQPESDLLGCLGFLSEDGLGLSSVTRLLAVITPSSLSGLAFLALLVLGDLVESVGFALAGTEGLPGFWNYHHWLLFN